MNRRVTNLIIFLILLAAEVFIALFVHDNFVRPYIGDVLVVIVVYYFVRIVIPEGRRWLPAAVFVFAACVEGLQYFHLVERLGLSENVFLRVLIGSVFDVKDIACYGAGCLILGMIELRRSKGYDGKRENVTTDDV
ncbi:MAG: DUF2809 domain-containing protein [Alistipes sp.]|nr:DUF2809 domain-containing protein [Alistipes sp.]